MDTFDGNNPQDQSKAGNVISIVIPDLSQSMFYIRVLHQSGSAKQGKIKIFGRADESQAGLQLIWKKSTGWTCWLKGHRYTKVQVTSVGQEDHTRRYI